MTKRPTSITVVGWFLVITGLFSLVSTVTAMLGVGFGGPQGHEMARKLMEKSLLPIPVQYAIAVAGTLVTVVAGIGVLKGMNWSRWLYVVWTVLSLAIGLATSPMKTMMLPGIVFLVVIGFFLFRPTAGAFFRGEPPPDA